ncbi:hypothetical protein [Oceanicola sp. 22II-s10i]|uniref:hypothetical protein n=1 Tax=Oceanicola sp. 22II-s10i TaxID=1317116 RepID=UPI0011327898|nr:hypothetical protein [Oceanicola sp. 22II-s10i]
MSAIEWLDHNDTVAALRPDGGASRGGPAAPGRAALPLDEPPVSAGAGVPDVSVTPLDGRIDGPVGLIPTSVTGLPVSLWRGSDPARLDRALERVRVERLPAMQALLYALLLTESLPPDTARDQPDLLLARLDRLVDLGSVEPAKALAEHVGPERHPGLFRRYFDMALLTGTETEACARIAARPDLSPGTAAQVYCMARLGDWNAAMLTFSTMRALGEFDSRTEVLLELFLEPELIEIRPALAPPSEVTPMIFRLQEALGQPLATATLPRAYSIADLRDVSGWKAELEAVERLARTGALSGNRLLGVYTARRPAASGGVWDRVAAVQAFDAAMQARDTDEIGDRVTAAWAAMRSVELEVLFAGLYGADLADVQLTGSAARRTAFRMAMLSPGYEAAAATLTPATREETFLIGLAKGTPRVEDAPSALARAVAQAFADPAQAIPETRQMIAANRLGELLLQAIALYASGVQGEHKDAVRALATFRAVGLEDTARQAALQLLILDRNR